MIYIIVYLNSEDYNMLKVLILNLILLFPITHASCLRHDLLDSYADSLHECIRTQQHIPMEIIQKKLDFIEEEKDEKIIKEYSNKENLISIATKIQSDQSNDLKVFFTNCNSIYDFYEEIDKTTQAAVLLLCEKVFEKYEQHSSELAWMNSLLPSRITASVSKSRDMEGNALSTKRVAPDSQEELLEQLPLKYRATVKDILTQIAFNFFQEVSEGRVTLETLSSKFQLPVEELRSNYRLYIHQTTQSH